MRLYLIRHGQSINNALAEVGKEDQRHYDPDMTEKGYQQAELIGKYVAQEFDMPGKVTEPFALTHLYCSPMYRALLTAKPIAEATGITPEVWPDIFELGGLFLADNNGNKTGFPGLTRSEIQTRFPNYVLPDRITEEGWYDASQGIERVPEFATRAIRVAIAIQERAANSDSSKDRIALVTHGDFMDVLIKALLNQLPTHPETLYYTHYNTGITRIDLGEGFHRNSAPRILRLHYLNRTAHLSQGLRTY